MQKFLRNCCRPFFSLRRCCMMEDFNSRFSNYGSGYYFAPSTKHSITPTGYTSPGSDGNYGASRKLYLCGCIRRNWFTSLAERGTLHRPLTSSKLKELLDARLSQLWNAKLSPPVCSVCRQISNKVLALGSRLLGLPSSASSREK